MKQYALVMIGHCEPNANLGAFYFSTVDEIAGFYTTPGAGINQVRIAYVLKKKDLERALFVLRKALEAYPGRVDE